MKLHANARLSVKGRALLVDRVEHAGWSLTQAAEAAGVSERTARTWRDRHRAEGPAGLGDRSSAPQRVANRTDERRAGVIAALRRQLKTETFNHNTINRGGHRSGQWKWQRKSGECQRQRSC